MTTRRQDQAAVLVLVALWLLFFWRLFTPIPGDQASIKQGDFSGQFVAFASYQYDRFTHGEIPLWNPYNNGGLPFIGDTQAAVFYPPRLATIALSALAGGWSYHALELEMAAHVLAYSLMMYALVRRMTRAQTGSVIGGLTAALIASYGGFLSGYPPQQLAILEAAIWLPLGILGTLEATREAALRWPWLVLAGFALGLSWMAGHPQTSWFLTYLMVAFLAYRIYHARQRWTVFVGGTALIGVLSGGMAAVQLLPGLEYLAHTARVGLMFEDKANGFPVRDLLQFLFPGQLSLFSPLYIGIGGLALVLVLVWFYRSVAGSRFWLVTALIALGLSLGSHSAIFPALYNLLPGLRFFRGQERAAYLVASSLAILAGLSIAALLHQPPQDDSTRVQMRRTLWAIVAAAAAGIVLSGSGWLNNSPADSLDAAVFSTFLAVCSAVLLGTILHKPDSRLYPWLWIGLLCFDLFSLNMAATSTYDPVPPTQQLSLTPPPLIAQVLADEQTPFRVDGFRGLTDNYGSLDQVMDMRGISPLFLDGPYHLNEPDKINPLAWELFAVRYVFTDWQALPVSSEIVDTGEDRYGAVNLHRLRNPRPFAHLVYRAEVPDSDAFAYALLDNPDFDPRQTVILDQSPPFELPADPPDPAAAIVTDFAPEHFAVTVTTPENAILTLAHPDYPGWQASIDGDPAPILRAYGALSAIAVPTGDHTITLTYDPLSYKLGAGLSLFTWGGVIILGVWALMRKRHAGR
ncbi:MAG: YfhO family protein [Anaerolineae bacterium]|nr:YfhO family protein [Anaerolineae bacterium]